MIGAGDRVVCVNDRYPEFASDIHPSLPSKGQVYVVRGVISTPDGLGLYLVGIHSHTNPWLGHEQAFRASRFRKLCTDPGKKKETSTAKE